jgi:uncharacterized protein (AIM24 family)
MPKKQKGANVNVYDDIVNNSTVTGTSGSQHVEFKLGEGHTIITALGSMIYMKGGIQKAEIHYDGIGNSFKKWLSGESFVYQKFSGTTETGTLVLGSSFINSIMILRIKSGDEYRLSKYCFLACTDNIKISMTTQMKGIIGIGQEGFILPIASCINGEYGYLWLSAYGNLHQENIENGDSILVDNGMFLACNNYYQYDVEQIGKSLFSSFMGGEGFGMKFQGPCVIYIQTKNINDFLKQPMSANNNNGFLQGALNLMSDGGAKKKQTKKILIEYKKKS